MILKTRLSILKNLHDYHIWRIYETLAIYPSLEK
ncbi:hypothetical protein F960_03449 [Acinetobacter gerneri DSM 14967 = CIP 107464 = MTCC 9824]|uniref:Uncharacterized protein n=1 Tax=Acinetobacter gerneri DSM 14967 = CIP 107464 = MTCC 9824 TaxID=1120926 RepID=N8ZEB2_9GAMM|nr:hypothetical protein F960_03449 [Acinetobacter gerneri DSM 14967 = CIP 107464 = MTCC 9824]